MLFVYDFFIEKCLCVKNENWIFMITSCGIFNEIKNKENGRSY